MNKTKEKQATFEEYVEVKNELKIWKPSVNDAIEGKIIKRQKSNFGMSYILEKEDGAYLLPNHVVLEGLLDLCSIGDKVRIVCVGSSPNKDGKNPTTLYKVFVKK